MQQLVYAIQFKGTGRPIEGQSGKLRVEGEAASASATSVIHDSGGLTGGFDPAAVVPVHFESDVVLDSTGRFTEKGSIHFGTTGNRIFFTTKDPGFMEPSPTKNEQQGAIVWKIEGGEGQFLGAEGIITSNFTVDDQGVVTDYQLGIIYIK